MWHENMAKVSLLKEKFVKKRKEGRTKGRKKKRRKDGKERCASVSALK